MPELFVVGEIEGATEFPSQDLYCKYKLVYDENYWELQEGVAEGQTQVDFPTV
jgi:B9 domain-containing protein 2